MRLVEADWIREKLLRLGPEIASPLANLGSSTAFFRSSKKPHIEERLMKPLRDAGFEIVHIDMKAADGVDMVGDLADPNFVASVKARRFKTLLSSNLFEHVAEPGTMAAQFEDLVPAGGHLIITVPRHYPWHPDPIDTLFRPTPAELAALFPHCNPTEGEILEDGTVLDEELAKGIASLVMLPPRWCWLLLSGFWRPTIARACFARMRYLFKTLAVTCILLTRVAD